MVYFRAVLIVLPVLLLVLGETQASVDQCHKVFAVATALTVAQGTISRIQLQGPLAEISADDNPTVLRLGNERVDLASYDVRPELAAAAIASLGGQLNVTLAREGSVFETRGYEILGGKPASPITRFKYDLIYGLQLRLQGSHAQLLVKSRGQLFPLNPRDFIFAWLSYEFGLQVCFWPDSAGLVKIVGMKLDNVQAGKGIKKIRQITGAQILYMEMRHHVLAIDVEGSYRNNRNRRRFVFSDPLAREAFIFFFVAMLKKVPIKIVGRQDRSNRDVLEQVQLGGLGRDVSVFDLWPSSESGSVENPRGLRFGGVSALRSRFQGLVYGESAGSFWMRDFQELARLFLITDSVEK